MLVNSGPISSRETAPLLCVARRDAISPRRARHMGIDRLEKRRAKVTEVHLAEAARLRMLWDSRPGERMSQAEFGEAYGIGNQSAVYQFLSGRTPLSFKAALGFIAGLQAAGHNISLRDLSPRLQEHADKLVRQPPGIEGDEFVDVPRVLVALSAGTGTVPHLEEWGSSLKFRASFLRDVGTTPASACVVDVTGFSMEPTITNGAVLLVSRATTEPRHMQIFAMRIRGELFVKRLVRIHEDWVARSDNEDRAQYPDINLREAEDVEIIGRALWMGARL